MGSQHIDTAPIALPTMRVCPFDPAPQLAILREQQPLCRLRYPDGHIGWLVTSYELAKAVLTDIRFSMQFFRRMPIGDPATWAAVLESWKAAGMSVANLLDLDPPEHTRYRRLLVGQFSGPRVENLRRHIEQIVVRRLDAMDQAGAPIDLVKEFSEPVALSTHCVLLGIPESKGKLFERLFDLLTSTSWPTLSADEVRTSFREFRDDFQQWIAAKHLEPGDDLTSHIVASGELNDDEIFSLIAFLFQAGRISTGGMLSLAVIVLLAHPEQLQSLRAAPASINNAVEELLRYITEPQTSATTRMALEDVELNGMTIKAGESVTVSLAAANRDPAVFEHPDTLDLSRSKVRGQLAFGQGIHMCLGQHVGRLELQIGILRLIERFPKLRLAIPIKDVSFYSGDYFTYGVHVLPVSW
jgi:cytochrome P450